LKCPFNQQFLTQINLWQVLSNQGAVLVPLNSILLGRHKAATQLADGTVLEDRVVAVRLPYMTTSHFKLESTIAEGHLPEASAYAFLVLVLPNDPQRKWQGHEFDMVTAVADQVCIASCCVLAGHIPCLVLTQYCPLALVLQCNPRP
jgi:hypothetical protein